MKIIAQFSDYNIQSVDYFLKAIDERLKARDIAGLTMGPDGRSRIELINLTKEHPLVVETKSLLETRTGEPKRAGLLPAISVTPGNLTEEGAVMGESVESSIVDDNWINKFKGYISKNTKEIHADLLITQGQIETIIGAYKRTKGVILCQSNMWSWNEELNISAWTETADTDILIGTLLDSILSDIRVGTLGDGSQIRSMKYKPTKGLTNFNFGRVLYGTEYNVTFLNTYRNYKIIEDDAVSGHDLSGTFNAPGE